MEAEGKVRPRLCKSLGGRRKFRRVVCDWLRLAPAAAQTSTAPPWTTQSEVVVTELQGLIAGPMAVSPSGDVFLTFAPLNVNIHVTNKAGDSTGGSDVIARVNAGAKVVFALQLGGSSSVSAIALDAAENVYVAGVATAAGLPVTRGAYRGTPAGDGTPYLCKLSSIDGRPLFCTYLGDDAMQLAASSMSVDPAGNRQVLVMKFDPTGSRLIFAAEFGGSGLDIPWSILADEGGSVYVARSTTLPDFPGTANSPLPAPSPTNLGFTTPFVAKLNPAGTEIVYAVYGRTNGEDPINIAVDSAGEIHLLTSQFPNPNNLVQFLVRKYTADGTGVVYETPVVTDASGRIRCRSRWTIRAPPLSPAPLLPSVFRSITRRQAARCRGRRILTWSG